MVEGAKGDAEMCTTLTFDMKRLGGDWKYGSWNEI